MAGRNPASRRNHLNGFHCLCGGKEHFTNRKGQQWWALGSERLGGQVQQHAGQTDWQRTQDQTTLQEALVVQESQPEDGEDETGGVSGTRQEAQGLLV